jgi:hypothetical protein
MHTEHECFTVPAAFSIPLSQQLIPTKEDYMLFFIYRDILIIQGDSCLMDITGGHGFLDLSDQQSLHEHVSLLGLLPSYGYLKLTIEGKDHWK